MMTAAAGGGISVKVHQSANCFESVKLHIAIIMSRHCCSAFIIAGFRERASVRAE